MANEDILNYLKSEIKLGKSISEIKGNLISNGWDKKEINLAVFEFLKSNPILNKNNSIGSEDIFNIENIKLENSNIVNEEFIQSPKVVSQKKIFSKKWIIIIICILFLFLFLIFFNNKITNKSDFVDVSNGTIIEFSKNKVDIKISENIIPFRITGVDEYIVHYYIEGIKGDLAIKENVVINLTESKVQNITLRLDKIENKIPYIYIKG